jgi:hypothetical protein
MYQVVDKFRSPYPLFLLEGIAKFSPHPSNFFNSVEWKEALYSNLFERISCHPAGREVNSICIIVPGSGIADFFANINLRHSKAATQVDSHVPCETDSGEAPTSSST